MRVTLDIPGKLFTDCRQSGEEGGIRYWCSGIDVDEDCEGTGYRERDTGDRYVITTERWTTAIALMATEQPQHFADMMRGKSDRVTGDVLIQLACFGEVKYG